MPAAKRGHLVDTRTDCDESPNVKVAPSPKTPKQAKREARLRVSFSSHNRVHQFSVLQGDLDDRREHWHQILNAAALYNSDEDSELDDSEEETVEPEAQVVAASTSANADAEVPNSRPQRRSSPAAGFDGGEASR